MSLPLSDAGDGLQDETRWASGRAVDSDKETDDLGSPPTVGQPPLSPTIGLPPRMVGEYEVLERLGAGGMGEVYKARHRRLDKLVALKLLPAPAGSPHSREIESRFQREMKAVGALDHPNLVEAYDAGEQSGVVYLAMKLIDGVDLQYLVKQFGPLPITEACELVRQAALGLHYLHERGLVHRDVKPSNLMRTPEGTVKVLDLGLARWSMEAETGHGLTETGRTMGTPDFLAPEQVENAADADTRADLYGLGGTLFFLLTGRAPFAEHKSAFSKLKAHYFDAPPDVRSLRPEVPAELADLLHRLLAKKPEDRLATAAEVAVALAPFAADAQPEQVPTKVCKARPPQVPADDKSSRQRTLKLGIGFTTRKKSCSLTLAIGLTVAVLIGLSARWWFDSLALKQLDEGASEERSAESRYALRPIHVKRLDVKLTRNVNGRGLQAGLLGEKVFDPHEGDTVTVDARLTRPAYTFLIAFRPDGKVEVCFPETEDTQSPLTDNPRYPSTASSAGKEYGLTDGTGLQVFAVVVSNEPLPAFTEWWSQCKGCPWKRTDGPLGVVYRANGQDPVEAWNAAGAARGKGVEVEGKTPMAELAAWLLKAPRIKTVQVLGFAVGSTEAGSTPLRLKLLPPRAK